MAHQSAKGVRVPAVCLPELRRALFCQMVQALDLSGSHDHAVRKGKAEMPEVPGGRYVPLDGRAAVRIYSKIIESFANEESPM